ncbi:MAG: LTA synthase family protein, partial [Lachnospiraceae bacterium]|nr:LTA synthase family protein [Lachnospiraceae bacterium]
VIEHSTSIKDETDTDDNSSESTTEEPTIEEPIVYEPNVLNIDFDAFTKGENTKYITWLNDFFSASEPTMNNEYTGMFEGYNLILLTAESFSPWAVSEKYTPTLYKLVNEGFVFENFYTPAYNNTTQGEWTVCTGLMPNGMGATAFASSVSNGNKYMGMCFGNILGNMGYSAYAYHNHTHSYYNRDETHPNMGYIYKGKGGGLDVDKVWPASDLQMMELSVDDYINDEQFHAYYMTVSGHMNYTWKGNSMASRNRKLVADMEAPETMKGYMACNIELDKALEYLIKRLEEKGIADKTVIAMACDHYPYALESELTEIIGAENKEFYGLYESNLIIWSGAMKEPVHVDKVCSTIDIVPTLLNLMGIEYDSRLYSGKDILSDTPGLVIFSDMGFATDYCIYNSKTGNIRATQDVEITKEYISSVRALSKNIWDAAGRLINTDYYAKLSKYIKD